MKTSKSDKNKGSSPKVSGKRSKSNWKTERITQLLRISENDNYPPLIAEINAATRVIDLETALQNSKASEHDRIEKKIKEAFLKLNAVLGKKRDENTSNAGNNSDNPIDLEDTDSESGTGKVPFQKNK